MGMIGIVVVGNDKSNLDAVKKAKMRVSLKKFLKNYLKVFKSITNIIYMYMY